MGQERRIVSANADRADDVWTEALTKFLLMRHRMTRLDDVVDAARNLPVKGSELTAALERLDEWEANA
jgi:hypothetical protein